MLTSLPAQEKSSMKTKIATETKQPRKSTRKLKKVIAVRHGEYNRGTMDLNDEGRAQMHKLAEKLVQLVGKTKKIALLTSSHLRAVQSAEIIGSRLEIGLIKCDSLRKDEYYHYGDEVTQELENQSHGSDILIVVTHFEAPSAILNAFSGKHFGREVECFEAEKGNGGMLCLKTGEVVLDLFDP